MTDKIKFLDKEYTKDLLAKAGDDELLTLRNLVADNLGVSKIQGFKDHDTAVEQTWKALVKFDETVKAEAGDAEAPKVKEPKEPKERKLAKPAEKGFVKRPTRKMFSSVSIVKQHTGAEGRSHRWPNYSDGMLVIDAIESEGTLAWDIYNWEAAGLMKVVEPTDEQYDERRAAWYKKHGLEDPDLSKNRKAEEAAAAKAKKAEEAAAKKAAADEAKAAKAAEKAAAKEAAEKAKAEKAAATETASA